MQAMMAEMLNFSLCLMSAWMVGKVEAPAKANITEPKACNHFIVNLSTLKFNTLK